MRRDGILFPTTGTSLTITDSISRIRSHNFIVMLDHFFEIGDAQGVEIVFGSEVLNRGPRSFFLLTPKTWREKKRAGF